MLQGSWPEGEGEGGRFYAIYRIHRYYPADFMGCKAFDSQGYKKQKTVKIVLLDFD
jgi:hypothetical protein